ncbi:hypothetical protein BGZ83_005069 [Gryganskiella cystojenkinii]|nr:hypothetical protein BGZ83_005069 [Gryganskiella cystojenkinii]
MTDSNDFDETSDLDFSTILKDIDQANLALDSLDGRADKLTETLQALLKAQSQPNPFANVEAAPLAKDHDHKADNTASSTSTTPSTTTSSEGQPAEQNSK